MDLGIQLQNMKQVSKEYEEIFYVFDINSSSEEDEYETHTEIETLNSLEKYDYDRVTFSRQEVHGVRTLQATKTTCNTMILDVDSTVTCGNAELFIFVDDAYYQSIDINQVVSVQLEDITGKTVVVKIAAESAELNVFLKRTLIE